MRDHVHRFKAETLTGDYRPKKLYTYYVTGRHTFPFDMLRYDRAWPADGEAASRMASLVYPGSREDRSRVLSIKMYSYSEPTVDRWSSFGWSVGLIDLTTITTTGTKQ